MAEINVIRVLLKSNKEEENMPQETSAVQPPCHEIHYNLVM